MSKLFKFNGTFANYYRTITSQPQDNGMVVRFDPTIYRHLEEVDQHPNKS